MTTLSQQQHLGQGEQRQSRAEKERHLPRRGSAWMMLMSDWIAISRSAPFHPHACKGHETERDKRPAREHPLREREKTERLKERIRVLKSDLA
jgi:hypothetical protein